MLEISNVGLLTAFVAGAISFLSPCVLPIVPGYLSYIAGRAVGDPTAPGALAIRLPVFGLGICFVLGFSTVFILLGASATALGQLLLSYRWEFNIGAGVVVIIFGLFLMGIVRIPWLYRDFRFRIEVPGGKPAAAFVLGLAFAFGWTPCIGPILGAILTVSAAQATVKGGIVLLAIYSLGLGLPFLVAALFTDSLAVRLRGMARLGRSLQLLAGILLVVMGVAMITGYLSAVSYWLLEMFPVLGNIG